MARLAFPGIPHSEHRRRNLTKRFNKMLALRNRIFHHEPIWHWGDLEKQHAELLEAMDWINPVLRRVVEDSDRFLAVYRDGLDPHYERLRLLAWA